MLRPAGRREDGSCCLLSGHSGVFPSLFELWRDDLQVSLEDVEKVRVFSGDLSGAFIVPGGMGVSCRCDCLDAKCIPLLKCGRRYLFVAEELIAWTRGQAEALRKKRRRK